MNQNKIGRIAFVSDPLPRPCNWPYNWLERIIYAFRPPRPDFSRKDFFWFRDVPHPRPYYRPKGGAM